MTTRFSPRRLFQVFKYTLYLLLALNVGYFLQESLQSADVVFREGVGLKDLIVAFAGPIDSLAWVVLLYSFELETAILDDETLNGPISKVFTAIAVLCYGAILYSWWGFLNVTHLPTEFITYQGAAPCTLVGKEYTFLVSLDDYVALTAENCAALVGDVRFHPRLQMFATPDNLLRMEALAWTDVANASIWLIIVAVLQLEIQLESSKLFGLKFFKAYKASKSLLYGGLFVVAVIWATIGDPIDAWDAALWMLAFFCIELNVFAWQEEVAKKRHRGIYSDAQDAEGAIGDTAPSPAARPGASPRDTGR